MTRNITGSFREHVEANFSGDVDLIFLTISHPDLDDDIHVVLNDEDFSHDGSTFIGFPFDIQLLSDDEQPPTAQLQIQNVDSSIGESIRLLTTPPRLKIELLTSESYFPYKFGIPRTAADLWAQAHFETGDTSELSGSSTGTFFADNSKAFRGNWSLKLEPGSYAEMDFSGVGNSLFFTMHFAVFIPQGPAPGNSATIAAFHDAGDVDLFQLFISDDLLMHVSTPGGTVDSEVPIPIGEWVTFDWTMFVDPSSGICILQMNGVSNVIEEFGLNTGSTPVGRCSMQNEPSPNGLPQATWADQWEFYDHDDAGEDVIYVADKLFLTNVKVDVQTISGTIEGWNYLQRVWPGVRARQDIFPGLFK